MNTKLSNTDARLDGMILVKIKLYLSKTGFIVQRVNPEGLNCDLGRASTMSSNPDEPIPNGMCLN